MRHSLFWYALLFCVGIIFTNYVKLPTILILCLCGVIFIATVASLRNKSYINIFLSLLIFFSGASRMSISIDYLAPSAANELFSDKEDISLEGAIVSDPFTKNNITSFVLKTTSVFKSGREYKIGSKVLVYATSQIHYSYGQVLYLFGKAHFSSNEKYARYLRKQGIVAVLKVENGKSKIIKLDQGNFFVAKALLVKAWIQNQVKNFLSPLSEGIFSAMILGDHQGIKPGLVGAMMKTGTIHILVVSGFNVGLVGLVVGLFLKILRIPRFLRFVLIIIFLVFYCFMTGASNPVIRATIMAIIFIFSLLIKREADIFNALGLSALFILAQNPLQLFDIGFQLSFISVISIVWVYPKLRVLLAPVKLKGLRYLLEGCFVSFSAWAGTLTVIAYHFRMVSLVAILANILIVPLASLLTLCGFALIFAIFIHLPFSSCIAESFQSLALLLVHISYYLAKLPLAYFSWS